MTALLEEIKARAQGLETELVARRREFHQHPELSHQEERTARSGGGTISGIWA